MMRELGLRQLSRKIADKLRKEDPSSYRDLLAYAEGVNARANNRMIQKMEFWLAGLKWEPW
jgi:acyl-homoserine lactone acylase PvdQ